MSIAVYRSLERFSTRITFLFSKYIVISTIWSLFTVLIITLHGVPAFNISYLLNFVNDSMIFVCIPSVIFIFFPLILISILFSFCMFYMNIMQFFNKNKKPAKNWLFTVSYGLQLPHGIYPCKTTSSLVP